MSEALLDTTKEMILWNPAVANIQRRLSQAQLCRCRHFIQIDDLGSLTLLSVAKLSSNDSNATLAFVVRMMIEKKIRNYTLTGFLALLIPFEAFVSFVLWALSLQNDGSPSLVSQHPQRTNSSPLLISVASV